MDQADLGFRIACHLMDPHLALIAKEWGHTLTLNTFELVFEPSR